MADPISLTSGLLTLVLFGLKASTSLYQTVKGFNSHHRNVRDLREELEALTLVLTSLNHAASEVEADFASLKLPLLRCGNACEEFEKVINRCTKESSGSRTSFRDWAKLKYMGDDIIGFKNMLAGYKSTITIALCDVNLRTSAVTTSVLNEYQEKIEDTMSDLEDHMQKVDSKLQRLLSQGSTGEDRVEWHNLQTERESIQHCLNICGDVSTHIDSARSTILGDISTPADSHHVSVAHSETSTSARRETKEALDRCKDDLAVVLPQLNEYLDDISRRQHALSQRHSTSQDQYNEQAKLQEEIESVKQSLKICTQASKQARPDRTNMFEEVSMADDGHQLLVSTFGDLVFARKVTAGARSVQWLGQMSDESLQQLSKNHIPSDQGRILKMGADQSQPFENIYGRGRNL